MMVKECHIVFENQWDTCWEELDFLPDVSEQNALRFLDKYSLSESCSKSYIPFVK